MSTFDKELDSFFEKFAKHSESYAKTKRKKRKSVKRVTSRLQKRKNAS